MCLVQASLFPSMAESQRPLCSTNHCFKVNFYKPRIAKKHFTIKKQGFYRFQSPPRRPPPPPPLINSGLLVAKETLITLPLNSFPAERQETRERSIQLSTAWQQVQKHGSDLHIQTEYKACKTLLKFTTIREYHCIFASRMQSFISLYFWDLLSSSTEPTI